MFKALNILVFLAIVLSACGTKEDNNLKIGMEVGYPPMEMVDTDGRTPIGFDVDIGKELAKRLNKKDLSIINTGWDGIFLGLEGKKYDCIISSVSITKEREAAYHVSNPYVANRLVIITKKETTNITKPEDLVGQKTGVQVSTTSEDFLKEQIKNGKKIDYTPYPKITQAITDLKIGRIQAVVVDIVVAKYYLNQDKNTFNTVWQSSDKEPLGIVFHKSNKQMCDQTNQALEDMRKDGTLAKISEKWFGADITND